MDWLPVSANCFALLATLLGWLSVSVGLHLPAPAFTAIYRPKLIDCFCRFAFVTIIYALLAWLPVSTSLPRPRPPRFFLNIARDCLSEWTSKL